MSQESEIQPSTQPDYGKIIFVGVPLTFIVLVALFLVIGITTRNAEQATWGAISVSIIFAVAYILISRKFVKLKTNKKETEETDSIKRNLSKNELIAAGLMVTALVSTLAICELLLNIDSSVAMRYLTPVLLVFVIIERKIKKNNT